MALVIPTGPSSVTLTQSAGITANTNLVLVDTTSNNITVSLPNLASHYSLNSVSYQDAYRQVQSNSFYIKKVAAANTVTIQSIMPGVLIEGAVSITLTDLNESVVLKFNGYNFYIGSTSSGSSGGLVDTYIAGAVLGGDRVVMLNGGLLYYYDPTVLANYGKIVGISKNAALVGETVKVTELGLHNNPGWGLTPDSIYYATTAGNITITPPTTGITQVVGYSKDANSMVVTIKQQVKLV